MTKQVNRTICTGSVRGVTAARRRGVALMLVVVAMGTATVMTTAYLLSKDNSAAIGANAQDTAASVWAANSGADLALAILQTEEDWVDADPEKLLEGFSIAGGTVSIVLTDLQGNPPAGTETDLAMTVVAHVNGVKTVIQRIVTMKPEVAIDVAIDPELSEFGVFAHEYFYTQPDSVLAPWPLGPAFKSGGAVKLGIGFKSGAKLSMDAGTRMLNVELYVCPDAQDPLKLRTKDNEFSGGAVLGFTIPCIPPNMPAELVGLPAQDFIPRIKSDNSGTPNLDAGIYAALTVENNSTIARFGSATGGAYVIVGDLVIQNGAILEIEGDVHVGVFGDLSVLNGATIVLADDTSSLRVYSLNNVTISNACVGVPSAIAQDFNRVPSDIDTYIDPAKIRFYAISTGAGGAAAPVYTIKNQSIATMAVHAPTSFLSINTASSVIGRVTCAAIWLYRDCTLFYDQSLDPKTGYTAMDGPFYQSDGLPQDGLAAAMASYDTTLGLDAFDAHMIASMSLEVVPITAINIGDPTPRKSDKAKKKHWPFIAKAIESGSWVSHTNAELQEDLYVELDSAIFDLDRFYNDGVIEATYTGSGANSVANVGPSEPLDLLVP